jgi:leucyl/phenylalanyl-tRNA--protein transferase
MAQSAKSRKVQWVFPHFRGIIPLDNYRTSHNTRRLMNKYPHEVHINTNFEAVMRACANRPDTWISEPIVQAYCTLHKLGFAHSVEVYRDSVLVGGLYGVTLGAAFFGESMFRTAPEMDKFAMHYCHQRLHERGFVLWDTQFWTEHLARFGCIEIPAAEYLQRLEVALDKEAFFDEPPPTNFRLNDTNY